MNRKIAWHEKTAFEVAKALQDRSLSAQAYLDACLDQIDAREPEVRAFAYLHREGARAQARALDAGAIQGAMHGLTIGIKDVFDTFDMPTEGGSTSAGAAAVQDVLRAMQRRERESPRPA